MSVSFPKTKNKNVLQNCELSSLLQSINPKMQNYSNPTFLLGKTCNSTISHPWVWKSKTGENDCRWKDKPRCHFNCCKSERKLAVYFLRLREAPFWKVVRSNGHCQNSFRPPQMPKKQKLFNWSLWTSATRIHPPSCPQNNTLPCKEGAAAVLEAFSRQ